MTESEFEYLAGAALAALESAFEASLPDADVQTKGTGVRVTCVHPGATWTPSWAKSGVKEQRIMPADDIARASSFVA